jgi:hypothetical protein
MLKLDELVAFPKCVHAPTSWPLDALIVAGCDGELESNFPGASHRGVALVIWNIGEIIMCTRKADVDIIAVLNKILLLGGASDMVPLL